MGGIRTHIVDDTLETIAAFKHLDDGDAIIARLSDALGRFGFTAFVVASLPAGRAKAAPQLIVNGWPEEWSTRYAEAQHHRHDPCARYCAITHQPFTWEEIPASIAAGEGEQRMLNEAAEFRLRRGLCVPVHNTFGVGGLSMAGEFVELSPSERWMVHLLSLYAFDAAERVGSWRVQREGPGTALSPREQEVLRWAAMGKTAQDIGSILGIADATVGEHFKNIRRKLGTTNTTHSVVEALRRNEIRL